MTRRSTPTPRRVALIAHDGKKTAMMALAREFNHCSAPANFARRAPLARGWHRRWASR